ncbi:MAG: tetratricopeptide repeat protein [Ignavibacteria bacterium]|nr:tetratricopeptide repeat protein [Ignavibacteria bacterium]
MLVFKPFVSFADDLKKIDSLNQLIGLQSGENRIKTIIALSEVYRLVSFDKSMKTGQDAVVYADENGFQELKASALKSLGQSALLSGDYELAFDYCNKALSLFEQNKNLNEIALTLNQIGFIKMQVAEYEDAIEYYKKSVEKSTENKNDSLVAFVVVNIGNAYFEQGKLDEAFEAFYRGQLLSKKHGDSIQYAKLSMNIGMIYWQWDKNDTAIAILQNSIAIMERFKVTESLSLAYNNIGLIYLNDKNNPIEAEQYFDAALKIREANGAPIPIANVLVNKATVYIKLGKAELAVPILKRSLEMYETTNQVQGILRANYHLGEAYRELKLYTVSNLHLIACFDKANAYNLSYYSGITIDILMKNYTDLNDFESFLKYFKIFKTEYDTLINQNNQLATKEAHLKFKIEEIMPQFEALSEQNTLLNEKIRFYQYLLSSIVGVLIILVLIFFSRKFITGFNKKNG